ncbi:MAG: hypothetical protein IPI67_35105 [Myxococcales bacterium]|nr:hypothetical protein [Myxococcales bacterium]
MSRLLGGIAPARWGLSPSHGVVAGLLGLLAIGCGSKDENRTLEPIQLGMTKGMGAIYESDEMSMYEVKKAVAFPIRAPTAAEQAALSGAPVAPFPSKPWLQSSDLKVQVTWTLTNLDAETHNVEMLIDPWNEFGRYWPGLSVTDAQREEQMPNLSGIDVLMELPGTASGRASRRHGIFTYEDMKELSIDLATAMNIIATAPPPDPAMEAEDNPAVGLVNHAFAVENRSYNDVVIQSYIPTTIPGLTGFDIGLRTYEEANVAIEILVEVVDPGSGKVVKRDENVTLLPEPATYITIGNGSY